MIETNAHDFKFIGGWLCLDFANTLGCREGDRPNERLYSYSDLISWSQQADLLTHSEARNLFHEAKLRTEEAKAAFQRGIILREAIYRIFSAIASHKSPNDVDLDILNTELCEAMTRVRIIPTTDGYALNYPEKRGVLDRALWPIARSAADLLTSNKLTRIRKCAAKGCAWLFLDMSRNRSRRWCDMKDCGNRIKARRHYERKRGSSTKPKAD